MAEAGTVTVAEVEEIVPTGSLDPHMVHTPGIYVNRVVVGEDPTKVIERRKTRSE
jgi:3-oxoacid CoA-transferase subunit A